MEETTGKVGKMITVVIYIASSVRVQLQRNCISRIQLKRRLEGKRRDSVIASRPISTPDKIVI